MILRRSDLDRYSLVPEALPQLLPPDNDPVAPRPTGAQSPSESQSPPKSQKLTPKQAGRRLRRALDQVEATASGGKKDPLGYVIVVNFTLEGFKGDRLLLTWSLDGQDTPWHWHDETLSHRLEPSRDLHDRPVEIWVPDLIRPGSYSVNVSISEAEDNHELIEVQPFAIRNK